MTQRHDQSLVAGTEIPTLALIWSSQVGCPARQQQRRAGFVSPIKRAIELASLWVGDASDPRIYIWGTSKYLHIFKCLRVKTFYFQSVKKPIKKEHTYIT